MDKVKHSKKVIQNNPKDESKEGVISQNEIKNLNNILKKLGIYIFYYERRGGA
ncbi:MAG: hypothetical protein HWN67_10010 [Candidatus Helarchaeota archaeon]|nr:hypothetical protein [Candidatus Helarchaeota archaeon]